MASIIQELPTLLGQTDYTIPGWYIGIAGVMLMFYVWVVLQLMENKQAIKLNEANDQSFRELITEKFGQMKRDIDDIKKDQKEIQHDQKAIHNDFTKLSGQIIELLSSGMTYKRTRKQ